MAIQKKLHGPGPLSISPDPAHRLYSSPCDDKICSTLFDGRRDPRKRDVLRMLLEDYLRCSGGLAKQATGRKPVVCALCTHRPGGASLLYPGSRMVTRAETGL
jgi:hypothetical protein